MSLESLFEPLFLFTLGGIAWLYRTLVGDQPEPFVLSSTLFAAVGVLTTTISGQMTNLGALFICLSLVAALIQILVYRGQKNITWRHINSVLSSKWKLQKRNQPFVDEWTTIALEIIKVDFYPELYERIMRNKGPRHQARERLVSILPDSKFDKKEFSSESLEVPPETRRWSWRTYVFCWIFSWILYFTYVLWR